MRLRVTAVFACLLTAAFAEDSKNEPVPDPSVVRDFLSDEELAREIQKVVDGGWFSTLEKGAQESFVREIPALNAPKPLKEPQSKDALRKLIKGFGDFAKKECGTKWTPYAESEVSEYQRCLENFLTGGNASQLVHNWASGSYCPESVGKEADRVVGEIADSMDAANNIPLNKNASALMANWEAVRKLLNSTDWQKVECTTAIASLGESWSRLRASLREAPLTVDGNTHPDSKLILAEREKLEKAVAAKLAVLLDQAKRLRLEPYLRLRACVKNGTWKEAIPLIRELRSGAGFIGKVDFSHIDDQKFSRVVEETLGPIPPELDARCSALFRGLRGVVAPTTPEDAIQMFDAVKSSDTTVRLKKGQYASFTGEYAGQVDGYHLIDLGDGDYVAFISKDKMLDDFPDGEDLTIVGPYLERRPFNRVSGATTRAPVISDPMIFDPKDR